VHVRLELLNLARGVAVVSLLATLGVGAAVHDVVAEVHRRGARTPRLASGGRLLRAQSGPEAGGLAAWTLD